MVALVLVVADEGQDGRHLVGAGGPAMVLLARGQTCLRPLPPGLQVILGSREVGVELYSLPPAQVTHCDFVMEAL